MLKLEIFVFVAKFGTLPFLRKIRSVTRLLRKLLQPIALHPQLLAYVTGTNGGVSSVLRLADVTQPLVPQLRIDPLLSRGYEVGERGHAARAHPNRNQVTKV